jgi:hypothetical protein
MFLARGVSSADPENSKDYDPPVGLQDKVDREAPRAPSPNV